MDEVTEATEAMMVTMEAVEEVTAATADSAGSGEARGAPRRFASTRYFSCTGRCSKGMQRHGGSIDGTIERPQLELQLRRRLRQGKGHIIQDVHWHSRHFGTHHSPSHQGVDRYVTAGRTLQRPKLK